MVGASEFGGCDAVPGGFLVAAAAEGGRCEGARDCGRCIGWR